MGDSVLYLTAERHDSLLVTNEAPLRLAHVSRRVSIAPGPLSVGKLNAGYSVVVPAKRNLAKTIRCP
jgi:hypothetical protein